MAAHRPFGLRPFAARLRGLVRGRRDDDFDDEIREHLRLLTDRFVEQGMSREAAAVAAHRQFGNPVLLQEDRWALQTLPSVEALWRDVQYGVRFLRRNISFTVVCVALFALGIGLSVTIFAIVNGALLQPWPYRGYDRLVTIRGNYPQQGRTDFSLWSPREIDDLTRDARSLAYVIAGDARDVNLIHDGRPERVRAAVITPNAFAMLGVAPLRGRLLLDHDASPGAQPAVLVSYGFWQRLGASNNIVGHTLRIGDVPHKVVGVMPEAFVFWDRDLWMPLWLDQSLARSDRRFYIQAQLAEGSTSDQAEAELAAIAQQWRSAYPDVSEYEGLTFGVNLLVENVLRDLRPTLYLLLGSVVLVLVVATTNLANALLVKGLARDSELAVRRALGASAGTLARQLLIESGLLSAAGAVIGTAAAVYALPFVVALVPYGYIPAEAAIGIDGTVLAGAIAVAAGCGLLMAVMPAVRAARVDPASTLKSSSSRTGSRKTSGLRLVFVSVQLTIAVAVLGVSAAAAVGLRSVVQRHPGFDVADVWTTSVALAQENVIAGDRALTYRRLLDTLEDAVGSSATVALASTLPVGDLPRVLVSLDAASGSPGLAQKDAKRLAVSRSFFDVLDLPLLEGRVFADTDRETSQRVAVVTHSVAQNLWPGVQAAGRQLYVDDGTTTEAFVVVGVTRDVVAQAGTMGATPIVFLNLVQRPSATAVVMVKGGGENVMAAVRGAVARVDARMPLYAAEMLERARVATMGPLLLAATVLAVFGVAVLVVSGLGIYAVMSHSITERANETRLRVIFGASAGQLVAVELLRAMRIVAVSVACGVTIGAAGLEWLSSWNGTFDVSPISSLALAAVAVTLLGCVATVVPALRITRAQVAPRLS